jgi:hypothetical protein
MQSWVATFEAAEYSVDDAGRIRAHATAIKNMASTVEALAAARVAESNEWKRKGARSPAHDLAKQTGVPVGQAASTLNTAQRLAKLPETAEAARKGELSREQAEAIAGAAEADPSAEHRLLDQAGRSSLGELQDECNRTKAAADPDLEGRRARIRAGRFLREWTDGEGAGNLRARDNPEVIAAVMAAVEPIRDELFRKARAEGRREPGEAYAMDALAMMADRVASGSADGAKPRSDAKLLARFDFDALLRGYPIDGETCEIVGYGPVAVSAVRDMIDTGNPFLVAIATKGTEVLGVAHLGRKFTAAQVSALQWRDPTCVVEGCNQAARLQIDHRHDWAETKVSLLEWAERMCGHDHDKKTRLGWSLVAGTGKRPFVAPEDPRHPKNAGRAPPGEERAA